MKDDQLDIFKDARKYRYNGPEYVPDRDNSRLDSQLSVIRRLMIDGEWRTLGQIEEMTGYPPASISAQLRHLRKERFGSHIVERQHLGGGLYQYRVTKGEVE